MHLHHAYGNNAYPVIPAEQVLPADESARFDMGITHIFKVNGNKLHRTDTGLCKLLFNQLQHDRLSAAADTGHNLDQLRSTSVRVEQRSTGPLAPLESKTTVSTVFPLSHKSSVTSPPSLNTGKFRPIRFSGYSDSSFL